MATYCIGDVHGCFNELCDLLEKISFDAERDTLWFTGDLVNRGPDSLAVLRFVYRLPNKVVVLGNHALHLLAVSSGVRRFHASAMATLRQLATAEDAEELLAWLRTCPLAYYHPDFNLLLTHAGIYPGWSCDEALSLADEFALQLKSSNKHEVLTNIYYGDTPNRWRPQLSGFERYRFLVSAFTRMRFVKPNNVLELGYSGTVFDAPKPLVPWFNLLPKPQSPRLIFGHWAALNGNTERKDIIGLDTGCAWGNALSALCLDNNRLFQTPARLCKH